ncbi:MAG: ribonuclease [Lachnospiraceae bacterium]|nr:ribonuclease [Lachnospiraceae bacterium]
MTEELSTIEKNEDSSDSSAEDDKESDNKAAQINETENEKEDITTTDNNIEDSADIILDENGVYSSKDEIALYIHTYNKLPKNFMTKKEARALGWNGGSLEKFAKGMCIGGDRFGNYEKQLPVKKGRTYYECDVDTLGAKNRGAKRIIYSNDGYIYFTDDHYKSFTILFEGDN